MTDSQKVTKIKKYEYVIQTF